MNNQPGGASILRWSALRFARLRPRCRQRSRDCSNSQNALMKHAPRQTQFSKKRNVYSTSEIEPMMASMVAAALWGSAGGRDLRAAQLPSNRDQILPASLTIKHADDVSQHDQAPLFNRGD